MCVQGYGWLKDRILGEEGRRQQIQLRMIAPIAEKLSCSLAQLAIGTSIENQFALLGIIFILHLNFILFNLL